METVKCVLGFCYNCPSKKVSQKFLQISIEKMRDFFLFFALKKSLSGTETVARRVSSWYLDADNFNSSLVDDTTSTVILAQAALLARFIDSTANDADH